MVVVCGGGGSCIYVDVEVVVVAMRWYMLYIYI